MTTTNKSFQPGQVVYSSFSKHGGSLFGTPLVVVEVIPSYFDQRVKAQMAARIRCSDGAWYYPDYLSFTNPLD